LDLCGREGVRKRESSKLVDRLGTLKRGGSWERFSDCKRGESKSRKKEYADLKSGFGTGEGGNDRVKKGAKGSPAIYRDKEPSCINSCDVEIGGLIDQTHVVYSGGEKEDTGEKEGGT